jgi:putative Mn2+ efflux pump MntP
MGLDIRLPIGGMFSLIGLLLVIAGLNNSAEELKRSLGMNVNLWWGGFLILFGALMLIAAFRAKKEETDTKK